LGVLGPGMALIKCSRTFLLMLAVLVGQSAANSGELRKVWELDLRKIVRGTPSANAATLPVQLLRFSPDGQQIAVAVGWDLSRKIFKSQLLVTDVRQPEAAPKQFVISAGVGNEGTLESSHFGWSPDGKTVFAAGKVIRLPDGTACEPPPGWTVLIGNDSLVQVRSDPIDGKAVRAQMDAMREWFRNHPGLPYTPSAIPPSPPEPKSHFKFFDSECQARGEEWQVTEKWDIHDVSTERGLLAMTREVGFLKHELLIVDPFARKIIRRWPPDSGPRGQFVDGGKAMCGGGDVEDTGKAPLSCWEVDSGEKISEAPTINGGEPIAAAAHSSRIIASDFRRANRPLFSDNYVAILQRRVVLDVRTGKELVSWRPQSQSYININNEREEEPFQFAISPDGQYIAEGGNGTIHLYKIEP
jgi:hypothetical protein